MKGCNIAAVFVAIFLINILRAVVSEKPRGSDDDKSLETLAEEFERDVQKAQLYVLQKCKPEKFQHYYIVGHSNITHTNEWRAVLATRISTPRDVCLNAENRSYTRKCLHQTNGQAVWEPLSNATITCYKRTSRLNDILNTLNGNPALVSNATERQQRAQEVHEILENPKVEKTAADIDTTTNILTVLTSEKADDAIFKDVLGIYKAVHDLPKLVLCESSKVYNATNQFLEAVDKYIIKLTANDLLTKIRDSANTSNEHSKSTINSPANCVRSELSSHLSTFFINPACANVTGIAIYSSTKTTAPSDGVFNDVFSYRFLHANQSAEALMNQPDLEAAAFMSEKLWQEVEMKMKRNKSNKTELWIVVEVHIDDGLFIDNSDILLKRPRSKVITISIPNYNDTFDVPLTFILRNEEYKKCSANRFVPGSGCGYWNSSTWATTGVATRAQTMHQQRLVLCETQHLTPFSYFMHGQYKRNSNGELEDLQNHKKSLDIISLVGASLSLLGMLGIGATAAISPTWRANWKTKALLNVCVALALQMLLFICMNIPSLWEHFVSDADRCVKCVCLGAVLQYTTLVLFSWMLLVAIFQYKRFVQVFESRPRHYVLKSALAAWSFPLLPTLLVIIIDPESYSANVWEFIAGDGMCYPSGISLLYGVLLPISLVCFVNLGIFLYIFYSLSQSLKKSTATPDKSMFMRQVRLSILLFFLLGLSWIFGIMAFFEIGIAFSYVFCLTATLQGFVIFVYFVLLEKEPRQAWCKFFGIKPSYQTRKKNSDTQTMLSASSVSYLATRRKVIFDDD